MSNFNGEDLKTTEKKLPPCVVCGIEGYIEHEGLVLCNRHYMQIVDENEPYPLTVKEVRLFRSFFGYKKKWSNLTIDQIIEVRKTVALEKLARQLDFAKDGDGALYISRNDKYNEIIR